MAILSSIAYGLTNSWGSPEKRKSHLSAVLGALAILGQNKEHTITSKREAVALSTLFAAGCLCVAAVAHAANYIGEIYWIEVWPSGNVAFKLKNVTAPCNGQFLINASMPGARNMYAYLLTIKATKDSATVAHTTCGPADGYGGSYALVDYLYYY